MGILDGIVEWIAEQVMNILDLITSSVLGALGCSMDTFLRYFPAAETMYQIFLALAIGLILLNWVWQLFKNYFMGTGIDAEDPIKLSLRQLYVPLPYLLCKRHCRSSTRYSGNSLWLDSYRRLATFRIWFLQLCHHRHFRCVCQRRCCYRCPDFSANPCLELHQASFRGCRTLHLAGSSNLYCTSRL